MKKITLLLIALITTLQTSATHITGGQITSRCLGGLTQEVILTLYADLQALPVSNTVTVEYNSNNFNWIAYRTISHTTPYQINPTTMAYDFIDTITVPYFDSYTFSYSTCCRATNLVNTNPSITNFYVETIASVDTACNSTPIIPVVLFPYVNVNTQLFCPLNAYDLNGDSLGYELVTPLDNVNSPLGGFQNPPITISNTGVLTIYSSTIGTFVFCLKVTEYRNGVEIGYVLREMQFNVGTFNGINEVKSTKDYEFQNNYDIIGRKIK